jgi:hypothetical protein
MKRLTLPILATLALAMTTGASAGVFGIPLGTDNTVVLGVVAPGAFTDTLGFSLSGPSTVTDLFAPIFNVGQFSYSLYDLTTSTSLGSKKSYTVGSGSYDWIFKGIGTSFIIPLGVYFGDYHVSAAAVPELDTWLMLAVGAGLLVYQLRRRQSALRHSQLA